MNITPLSAWLTLTQEPLIISGPCSAESEKQMLDTAMGLSDIGQVSVFRAGIWKPRTRPDLFQGVGEKGLKWLQQIKDTTGLKTAVEVANPFHVEMCLKANVDVLWIGARTVVNPFAVEEISNALKGVGIPVMVKNPVVPDIKTWIGALERVHKAGVEKLIAIHRGFYYYKKSIYRNSPMWEIPIELKRLHPHLPVVCDPSHICGKKELLFEVSQKAMDLEMDGLMIESHINPEQAITDAAQQITPVELKNLLNRLVIRQKSGNIDFDDNLEAFRSEIDKLDAELLEILSRRMDIVKEIATYKKTNKITILQLKRWSNIITDRVESGMTKGISKEFLLKLLQIIHKETIDIQSKIINPKKS